MAQALEGSGNRARAGVDLRAGHPEERARRERDSKRRQGAPRKLRERTLRGGQRSGTSGAARHHVEHHRRVVHAPGDRAARVEDARVAQAELVRQAR
jgi:hypothetical protein